MHVSAMTAVRPRIPPDADRRSRHRHRPVVRVNDGFEEVHELWQQRVFLSVADEEI